VVQMVIPGLTWNPGFFFWISASAFATGIPPFRRHDGSEEGRVLLPSMTGSPKRMGQVPFEGPS